MEKSGIFSLVEISDKESDMFLAYMRAINKNSALDFIHYLIGIEYLKFLDLLAGTNFKVPSRKSLYRDIEYIKIYMYIKERNFDPNALRSSAKIYNKSISFVKRAVTRISKVLEEKLPYSYEDLNNIRSVVDDGKSFTQDKDSWAFEQVGEEGLVNLKGTGIVEGD